MTRLTTISQAIALFALAWSAQAQTTHVPASPATLKDAVERAILQNPEVKYRFHNFEASQQERKSAEGAWLPRIDLEAGTSSNETVKPSLASAKSYSANRASIQLRQTLFDGFATLNEVRRLSHAQQASYYELQSASNQIGLETARAYLDVIRYRELVEMAADNLLTHREVYERLNQKVQAGVGRRVDLEQASGRMALAESNWITEVSNLHDVSARYQRLVGDIPASTLTPQPLVSSMPQGIEFLRDAVAQNPDFLASVSTLRAFRADMNQRKSPLYPTLEFRARQSFETNQSGVSGDYRDSVMELVLSYNLFRGGSDIAKIKQYASKLNVAFDLRDKACRDTWQTGQIAYNDSVRLGSQIKLLQQHELSTSKARVAYQQQFDIGQRSLLDLLDTENEYYQARRALANAEYDLQLSHARVLASSGSLLQALQLRPLSTDLPRTAGGTEDQDDLMECSSHTLPSIERTPVPMASPKPVPPEPQPAPVVVAPAPVVPKPDPVAQACTQIPSEVQTWLAAWNSKDANSYLGHYADNFVPAMGLSRNAWENLRKKRIGKQGDIQAAISDIKPLSCDAKTAEVSFKQEYGSVDYRDSVEKTLSLTRAGDRWKIVRETVTKGRTF